MFQKTAESYRPGARVLPRESYISNEVYGEEQERIFAALWNCVGRASRLAHPGDYLVRTIAGESLIVVRGHDGALRAFFNVCRHRGTQLCADASGRFGQVIQCPYHAWTYTIEGALVGAPHMHDVAGFDKAAYALHAAAVAECDGFVFVCIAPSPPPFMEWFAPMADRLRRFGLAVLEVGHDAEYDVHANWKLVFENYSECLHCPVIHPELAARLPYESGANDLVDGPFLGGYMQIADPHASATMTGQSCAPAISATLNADERRRAYYYSVMPNLLVSIHPDYVNYYLLTPLAPDRTRIQSEWLFKMPGTDRSGRSHGSNENDPNDPRAPNDPNAFNPSDATAFWDLVNRQDWQIIERSQRGIASRRYVPGPYSPRESISAAWDREYMRLMADGRAVTRRS
jgi:Rieske 2Fe-2S family protein